MPWKVVKGNKTWNIVRSDTDKVVGHSRTRTKALASVRARYANMTKSEKRKAIHRRKEGRYGN